MGMFIGNIGPLELAIILAIVLVIFGAKKLRNLGSDLGGAIKNFRQSMKEEEAKPGEGAESAPKQVTSEPGRVIDAETTKEKKNV